MTFDTEFLNKNQHHAIQGILNKLGVSKSFPQWVVLGTKDLCSMALLDMSVEQGIHQVQHPADHLFSRDSIGNLILIALWLLQLESGCGFLLLERPNEWVPYITQCWLTSIWDFVDCSKIKSKVATSRQVFASCEHDQYLMDECHNLGLYNSWQLFDLNAMKVYLQVTTLSDVVDGRGKCITVEAYTGKKQLPHFWHWSGHGNPLLLQNNRVYRKQHWRQCLHLQDELWSSH